MTEKIKFELAFKYSKHELGHWFAARKYSFNHDHIKILIYQCRNGTYSIEGYAKSNPNPNLPEISDVYNYLTHRVIALQCGVTAEFMEDNNGTINCKEVESAMRETADNDRAQIEELINIAKGIRYAGNISESTKQEQFMEIHTECWTQSVKLIASKYNAIKSIASKMSERLILSQRGVKFEKSEIEDFYADYCANQTLVK